MTRKTSKVIGAWASVQIWCVVGLELALYLQDGFYEASAVMISLVFCVSAHVVKLIILASIEPLIQIENSSFLKKLQSFYNGVTWISMVFFWSAAIPMAITSRDTNGYERYNYIAHWMTAQYWIIACIYLLSVLVVTRQLQTTIVEVRSMSPQDTGKHQGLMFRIKWLQMGSIGIFLPYVMLSFVIPIVMLYLGSVPYFYVIFFIELITGCLFFTVTAFLFARPDPVSTKKKAENQIQAAIRVGNSAEEEVAPPSLANTFAKSFKGISFRTKDALQARPSEA